MWIIERKLRYGQLVTTASRCHLAVATSQLSERTEGSEESLAGRACDTSWPNFARHRRTKPSGRRGQIIGCRHGRSDLHDACNDISCRGLVKSEQRKAELRRHAGRVASNCYSVV